MTPRKKLEEVYGKKYGSSLDHQILTDHGVFYPQALYIDLVFKVSLAPAGQVVKGTDPTKLKYKLTNIELEYEMIRREELANDATSAYTGGKGFLYDHVSRFIVKPIDKTRPLINIKVHAQRRSIKGILLLPGEKRDNMVPEGIQSEDLCKIRSGSGDKKNHWS